MLVHHEKQIIIPKGPQGGWLKVWESPYPKKHASWKQKATCANEIT
jgi:hypothetical protein